MQARPCRSFVGLSLFLHCFPHLSSIHIQRSAAGRVWLNKQTVLLQSFRIDQPTAIYHDIYVPLPMPPSLLLSAIRASPGLLHQVFQHCTGCCQLEPPPSKSECTVWQGYQESMDGGRGGTGDSGACSRSSSRTEQMNRIVNRICTGQNTKHSVCCSLLVVDWKRGIFRKKEW